MDARARPRPPLVWTVALLSTIGYGAIYYAQPFTLALLVTAFIAPAVGRQMARPVNLGQAPTPMGTRPMGTGLLGTGLLGTRLLYALSGGYALSLGLLAT